MRQTIISQFTGTGPILLVGIIIVRWCAIKPKRKQIEFSCDEKGGIKFQYLCTYVGINIEYRVCHTSLAYIRGNPIESDALWKIR